MKTKLILGGFIALSGIASAQWTGTSPSPISTNQNVGIGTASPAYALDILNSATDGGARITQNFLGGSWLYLNNTTSNGRNWGILSSGGANNVGGGHFVLYDITGISGVSQPRFFINGTSGNVGIGTTTPAHRLHVATTAGAAGAAAVKGEISSNGFSGATGGIFTASGGGAGITTYGIQTSITNLNLGGINYALYASVSGNPNSGNGPNYAGYFNGDVVTTSTGYYFSDKRIKKNIEKMNRSLDIINKLNPVTYNFDKESNPSINLPSAKQYGFVSQEVQELLPEFTKTIIHPAKLDEKGNEIVASKEILGLNYQGFIALLTKGMQEQQQQIESQQKQISALQDQVSQLLNNKTGNATGINSSNTGLNGLVLSQNEPNPFNHETVIRYNLPDQTRQALMNVYDLTGKQIGSYPLTERGDASITITSETLAPGIYIYSVIADDKLMDSKRMVVTQK